VKRSILPAVLACWFAAAAWAQTPSPKPAVRLEGVVRTTEGLAVPGASIRAENTETHQAWLTWTDERGRFLFPALPAGSYRVGAEEIGFVSQTKQFRLTSAASRPITMQLPVATPAELEKGTETASQRAMGRGGLAGQRPGPGESPPRAALPPGVVNAVRQGMAQLPGRESPAGEAQQPEQSQAPAATEALGEASSSDAFIMNGSVGRGMEAAGGFAGPGGRFGGPSQPGQIAPSGAFPGAPEQQPGERGEFMRGGGRRGREGRPGYAGVAGLWGRRRILRRSVNQIRFGFFERYENSAWDARPYSLTGAPSSKIGHSAERLGANLGGPLVLPHVYNGRDRTFFFLNYTLDRAQAPVDTFATVPTLSERQGNFCDRNAQLFDPFSNLGGPRTALGCAIPSSIPFNSAAMGLLKNIPEPNLPGLAQNFHLQTTVPQSTDAVNFHLLHTISSRFNLRAGYNFRSVRQQTVQDFPLIGGRTLGRDQNLMLGFTQNWSPRLINDVQLNWSRHGLETLSNNSFGTDIAAALGITGISSSPINFGLPLVSFTNFTSLNDPVPALVRNQTLRFLDGVEYTLPRHTLQAGFELRRMQLNTLGDPIPRGSFTFTGLMTGQLDAQGQPAPGTGLDFADFLLGLPQATTEQFGSSANYFRSWGFVAYAQDDWRIKPRFTLEYGLRYEAVTPPVELFNAIANLDLSPGITAVATVIPGEPGPYSGPLPRALVRGDYDNWAPRLGMAWQPFPHDPFIVRAGYSIFYNESIYNQLAPELANQPPFAQAQTRLTTPTELLTLEDGFPPQPPGTVRNTRAVDPNYQVGYAQIWEVTLERQVGATWLVDVGYTGTKGTHLDMLRAPNRAPPGSPLTSDEERRIADAGGFTYGTFGASSIYHALQLRVRKRLAGGLLLYGIYTFGKSIDDASSIGGSRAVVVQNDGNFAAERGLSSFDVRHQFRGFTVYQLPFGETRRWARRGWKRAFFGDYRISSVMTIQTGMPFTALVGGNQSDRSGTGGNLGASFSERPDQAGKACAGPGTTLAFFNPAAFALPPPGRFGDAARNTICGPGLVNLDFALARAFRLGREGHHRLDLRWETHNLTNTPHFTGLDTVLDSATFGRVTAASAMRTMDLALRFFF
jgi:Carboxypeptidase regulatory-like domain/TonB dependent receptor-like, beta-barrel